MPNRLNKYDYFMKLAGMAASRSTCPRGRVGAILVSVDDLVVSTGYNGAPSGLPHCDDIGCLFRPGQENCSRTVHAEANACLQAPIGHRNLTVFCTHHPCSACLLILKNFFVTKIFFATHYKTEPNPALRDLLVPTFVRVSNMNPETSKLFVI